MTRILLSVFFALAVLSSSAQKFTLRGQAVDTVSSPMPSATVMLLQAKDSALVSFAATDRQGNFELKNINRGEYQLKITFVGYASAIKEIKSSDFVTPVMELGLLRLEPVSKELDALVIKGEKAPVTVKRDTIEFNAGSFKTKTNANVEDLLKRMPGIEVETDGSIKAQGEQVQRVMVDGREFFGRDPKLATRNLPADAVDKVQVFDKKSDQAVFTGIEDGQREKTINLELKEEKRKGAFGNLMGGLGTEERFQAKGSVNKFTKGEQLSFLGMGNNINEQGFSMDDYMNFSGGSQQMMGGGGRMTIQLDGNNQNGVPLNFGGRQNGIVTNYAGGINTNQDFGTKSKMNASYFYNNLNQNISQVLNRINYLPNGSYDFNQASRQVNQNDNHRANLTLDQQLDSANSFKFMASATLTNSEQSIQSKSQTMNVSGGLQNESIRDSYSKGSGTNLNSSLLFRHRFPKKGRTLSATLTLGLSQTTSNGSLRSDNDFYSTIPTEKIIEQTNTQKNESQTYGAQFSYTEPLGNRKYLEANYSIRTNLNDVIRDVYNVNSGVPIYNDTLSNRYKSNYLYNRPGINLRMNRQKFNVTVGASYQHTRLKGDLLLRDTTIDRTFENILPQAHFNYDFTSFKHFRLDYETAMQEPTIQQLQPVIDNSDPLNLSSGNPNLKPGFSHTLRLNYTQFDPASNIGFFAFLTSMYTTNAITYSQSVDPETLVRLTVPVNVADNMRINGNFNFGFPIRAISSRISLGPTFTYNRGITLINLKENRSDQRTYGGTIRYDYTFKEVLTLGLSANLSQNKTEYSFNTAQNQQYLNETYSSELNINFLKNYAFNTTFDFYHYRSQTTGFDQTIPLLNLSVSRFLLKNNVGELKLGVVNALDKSMSVSQSATSNYLQQETMNNLGRYYMVSFTYVLNKQLNPMGGGRGGRRGMRMMMNN
ncbi:MAG: TonB-dependent receptor family protein [Cyclobacteriaceae bacterium]|nr:TonB-dependent receptor family protein [Cyclobacteriaceae bacterium]